MNAIRKIILFASSNAQYGVIDSFVTELAAAFSRQGVESPILHADRENPDDFLRALLQDPPDCTLSFNGLLPDHQGRFLADTIGIPHIAYLTDAPTHFFPLLKSSQTIIASIDRDFCAAFRAAPFPKVLFLPHAASSSLALLKKEKPVYDLLMLNSFIDYEEIEKSWPSRYPSALVAVLKEAADTTLTQLDMPYMTAFIETFDRHMRQGKVLNPREIDHVSALDDLQAYIGGKSRVQMLRAIESARVDVFGSGSEGWKKYVGDKQNLCFHPPVPFTEALNLMRKTRILLHCTPEIKGGGHERIFNGCASGAVILSLETPYLREEFKEGETILFFQLDKKEKFNQIISSSLQQDETLCQIAEQGRSFVLEQHTWDVRARTLLKEIPLLKQK